MALRLELREGAKDDFNESFDWYAERSQSAAIEFATALEDAFDQILATPDRFPQTKRGCRYFPLTRYPFRVVYRQEADCLVVVAIAHAKRRPGYWHRRT
jgi:plasmid stabilization system protein ParE